MGPKVGLGVMTNKKTIVTHGTQTLAFQPVVFVGIFGELRCESVKSSLCLCSLLVDSSDDEPQCYDTRLLSRYMLVCYGLNSPGFDTRQEQEIFSSPERRGRFWGRRSLLFIGYQGSPQVNRPGRDVDLTSPHLIMSRSRIR